MRQTARIRCFSYDLPSLDCAERRNPSHTTSRQTHARYPNLEKAPINGRTLIRLRARSLDRSMSLIDLAALRRAPLMRDPFDFVVVPNFVGAVDAAALRADFPVATHGGLAPLGDDVGGPRFRALAEELRDP